MLIFLQQNPIVVEVVKQPEPAPDITIQVVIGMFAMAGVYLAIAALGGLLVGGIVILYRRHRDATTTANPESDHIRLRI